MLITEQQLKSWANPPSIARASNTYSSIKNALVESEILKGKKLDIYLQGSYGNHTNIKTDSDVDVVVQLNSVWQRDISKLTLQEQREYLSSVSISSYGSTDLRRDVHNALVNYYGSQFVDNSGNKSIKVVGNSDRLNVDVVPALQHRMYTSFISIDEPTFVEGIRFYSNDGTLIENYPKLHKLHSESKNDERNAGEHYKSIVRVIKNIKYRLINNGVVEKDLAPSYFVECLLYNVPNDHFTSNYQSSLASIVRFLKYECDVDKLIAVNHQHAIFGEKPWQWKSLTDANNFLSQIELFLGI